MGAVLGLTCAGTTLAQPLVYVDAKATGANDGSNWTDAYDDLQAALDAAESSGGAIREIWVADGTYKPSKRTDPDDPRSATFQLIDGVSLYGGFNTNEESIEERNIDANLTILSGDLIGDDGPNFANYGENAYHVVTGIRVGSTTIFDGCTVTGGHAPGPSLLGSYGGGMHLQNAYPVIRNCTFTRNLGERPERNVAWSGGGGAALFLYQENTYPAPPPLTVARSRFTDNSSMGDGGAVFFWGDYEAGSVIFSECSFERNVGNGAFSGAYGNAYTFRSCTFSDNSSSRSGAAISSYIWGGELLIEQCHFERNTARFGGAVYWDGGDSVTIHNSVFVDNSAESGNAGALLIPEAETVELSDSEFRGNSADYAGAVQLDWNGRTTVRRCQFVGNSANEGEGGGLFVYSYGLTEVTDCTFANNRAAFGGGLYGVGHVNVEHCVFTGNYVTGLGGGLTARGGTTLLTGCTFTHNSANKGGGLHDDSSSLTVIDSIFEGNDATIGGGVLAGYSSARYERCRFAQNSAYTGGGFAATYYSDFLFDRCEFTDNYATVGGGLSTLDQIGSADVTSCLFAGNTGYAYGGGIAGGSGPLRVINSTIAHNTAGALGAGMIVGNDTTITNSILWGNVVDPGGEAWTDEVAQIEGIEFATINYTDVQGWSGAYGGDGNIGLDPLFVQPFDPDGQYGPLEADFRLLPDSPCINAGLTETIDWNLWDPPPPNLDLDGKPRVLCNLVDMGAYESGAAGDVDCNLRVDLDDFSLWSECAFGPGAPGLCPAFDFDGDGDIDLVDFARFSRVFSPGSP